MVKTMGKKSKFNNLTAVVSLRIDLKTLQKIKNLQTDFQMEFSDLLRKIVAEGVEELEKVATEKAIERVKMEETLTEGLGKTEG